MTLATFHTHYCTAAVRIFTDYDTGRREIQAHIGTAPDDSTIIIYPYREYECGYYNKTDARKIAARMKKELLAYVKNNRVPLSEPLQYSERWS